MENTRTGKAGASEFVYLEMRDVCNVQVGVVELRTLSQTVFSFIEAVGIP